MVASRLLALAITLLAAIQSAIAASSSSTRYVTTTNADGQTVYLPGQFCETTLWRHLEYP